MNTASLVFPVTPNQILNFLSCSLGSRAHAPYNANMAQELDKTPSKKHVWERSMHSPPTTQNIGENMPQRIKTGVVKRAITCCNISSYPIGRLPNRDATPFPNQETFTKMTAGPMI